MGVRGWHGVYQTQDRFAGARDDCSSANRGVVNLAPEATVCRRDASSWASRAA
jgi:hypothetical protein